MRDSLQNSRLAIPQHFTAKNVDEIMRKHQQNYTQTSIIGLCSYTQPLNTWQKHIRTYAPMQLSQYHLRPSLFERLSLPTVIYAITDLLLLLLLTW